MSRLILGVNIDHVATLRQARYALTPDFPHAEPVLLDAARAALEGGAESLTLHLRADRRHIQDKDVWTIRHELQTNLNLEMGNTPEIVDIALKVKPDSVCLVPEHRQEITTEGGLDVTQNQRELKDTIQKLQDAGIRISLFVDPVPEHLEISAKLGAEMVELHTGTFANADGDERKRESQRLEEGARLAHSLGLQVNAGHGLTLDNLRDLFNVPHLVELNIGHHLVSRAIFTGLKQSVAAMRSLMNEYPEHP